MPKQKSLKVVITEAIMAQLSDRNPHKTLDDYIKLWWFTKSGSGLRLTPSGDTALRLAEIEFFDLPLNVKHTSFYSFLTDCNKKLKCPYFIGLNKKELGKAEPFIRVYDSKIAMLIQLYGDIKSYLESVRIR